jgi:hypothetical protein
LINAIFLLIFEAKQAKLVFSSNYNFYTFIMVENYVLNTRGQVRVLVFAAALVFCHVFMFLVYFPNYYYEEDMIAPAAIGSLLLSGAHAGLLALFNYFFRHPLVRYILLGVVFELILGLGFSLLWLIFRADETLNFQEVWNFYTIVHSQWETWYFVIGPSAVVVILAMVIEFKANKYHLVQLPKQKVDNNILDDIL